MRFASTLHYLRRLSHARGGNIAVMSALCFPVMLASAVFAVDEGVLFNQRRALQGLADLAAITAATHSDRAAETALMSLLDNGLPATLAGSAQTGLEVPSGGAGARVTGGRYEAAANLAPAQRFTPGATPFNAFKVELARKGDRYFAQGLIAAPTMRASAIGYAAPQAAFRIGSRLARLDGGVANAVLGALVGGELSLSAMDFRAPADARVDMLDLCDALATGLRLKAGTYDEVLDTSIALPDILDTMAAMRGQDAAAASALRQTARAADRRLAVKLGSFLDAGMASTWPLGLRRGPVSASAGVMEVVGGAAAVAHGGHQVEASLGAAVPGVLGASLTLAVGEREKATPPMRLGERNDAVRTAQTRFLLRLRLGGPGGALGSVLDLPIYGDVAYAEAKLGDIACVPGKSLPTRVTVNARPGLATLRIGETDAAGVGDFRRQPALRPAAIVDTRLVKVLGAASASITNAAADTLTFSAREIEAGTTKTAATRDLLTSPTASLLDSLQLDVQAGPLSVALPAGLGGTLSRTLREATEPADALLVSVLAALGVSLGEADVTVNGGFCNRAVLVQ